jgi:phage-related protein
LRVVRSGGFLGSCAARTFLRLAYMPDVTYTWEMSASDKPLVWLESEIRTPPFTKEARIEAGTLLRRLQQGHRLGLPHSRPMPSIGSRCHELRVRDHNANWRIVYRIDSDAIVIVDVFAKKTAATPKKVIDTCKARLKAYDSIQ